MPEDKFDAKALREAAVPPLTRAEMRKRMGISWTYIDDLESGIAKWPAKRREEYVKIIADWQANPVPVPRKKRSDAGLTHRARKRRKRKLAMLQGAPVPVAHSHAEVVGIG
jgi:hypothetical protein